MLDIPPTPFNIAFVVIVGLSCLAYLINSFRR